MSTTPKQLPSPCWRIPHQTSEEQLAMTVSPWHVAQLADQVEATGQDVVVCEEVDQLGPDPLVYPVGHLSSGEATRRKRGWGATTKRKRLSSDITEQWRPTNESTTLPHLFYKCYTCLCMCYTHAIHHRVLFYECSTSVLHELGRPSEHHRHTVCGTLCYTSL